MSAYMMGIGTMTSGTGIADATSLTAGAYWAIQGGTTTQLSFLDEIYLGGQATATAPAIMLLGRDSTVAGSTSAVALATPSSFGILHPSGGVITTVPSAFISCTTTQPQRSNSVTLGKKNFSFNFNGGIVRCNYANTQDRFGILGNTASLGEMSLSAFTGTTSGLFGGHLIIELQ